MQKPKKAWTRLGLVAAAALALFLAAAAALGPASAVASGTTAFEAAAQDGTRITVAAPEGAVAEGTTLSVRAMGVQDAAAAAADCDGAVAYEVSWIDARGEAAEPAVAACSVTIELGAGVLPQGADPSSAAVCMTVDGEATGVHALAAGSSATFEATVPATLAVTYLMAEEEAPGAEPEAAPEETAGQAEEAAPEGAVAPAAEDVSKMADPAAGEAAVRADETAEADAPAPESPEVSKEAATQTDASGKSSDGSDEDVPAEEPLRDQGGTEPEATPDEEGAKTEERADEADPQDPGTPAAEDTAADPALRAYASPSRTTRVYLYIYLDSLPQEVQNHLSWHSVSNNTTWVAVGYIDVPTSVLPAAQSGDIGKRYIFKSGSRAYEPRIAVGSSVKYSIHYFTPNYGNANGIRVDQNAYYQQIAAYINWNQLGLLTDSGADGYPAIGTAPAWHLDGYYTYSEKTLNIVKSVTGNFGDRNREYGFTATCIQPDGRSESISFSLADGESHLITVPTGTSITVTEESYEADGYSTTVTEGRSTATGRTWSTSSLSENATVTFTNHRAITPDVGVDLAEAPYLAILALALAAGALYLRSHRTRD